MTDDEVADVVLRAVCVAAELDLADVLSPGQLRTQVVPRRAAAVEVRHALGWSMSRACRTFRVSRALLLHPSEAHAGSELAATCRAAAAVAVAALRPRAMEDVRDDANERRRWCGATVRGALAARCLEHGVTTAQAMDVSGLLAHQRRRATLARHATILDATAAGVTREEVARVLGVWPETVSRVVSGARRAMLQREHARSVEDGGGWISVGGAG